MELPPIFELSPLEVAVWAWLALNAALALLLTVLAVAHRRKQRGD